MGWWKAKYRHELDGRHWSSNGHLSVAVPSDDGREESAEVLLEPAAKAVIPAGPYMVANGYSTFGDGRSFQVHFLRYAESLFPGLEWFRAGGDKNKDPIVGRVDGRPVAFVMAIRRTETPCGPREECSYCGGEAGEVCQCCGQDIKCEPCKGKGYVESLEP